MIQLFPVAGSLLPLVMIFTKISIQSPCASLASGAYLACS